MSNLIKNELIKIFKKKSIYIIMIIVLAFTILINCIAKYNSDSSSGYSYYSENYINEYVKKELAQLDPNKSSDTGLYIELKTDLDTYELINKYDNTSWQYQFIQENVYSLINEKNTYIYGIEKDENKVKEIENEINKIIEKLDNDDWKYFANIELEQAEKQLNDLEEQKRNTNDKKVLQDIDSAIENAKIDREIAQYRIDKEIKYGSDYLNSALRDYESSSKNIIELQSNSEEMNYQEKLAYNESLENKEISRYIIENNIDLYKTDTKGMLENFFNEYGIFIIVVIVMIAGTIVSEEFNKGTIKLLLVKPYSRLKILLSKYITTLIILGISLIAFIFMQLIVGGIVFGLDSLSTPVVQYNFNTNQLVELNIFTYLIIQILTQLPMLILLLTLAFALSTIFTNSALAITITLLGYMSPSIINILAIQYNVEIMKYFVTMNWDLSPYLFGGLASMEGMSLGFSIIVSIIYLLLMIIPTYIIFKKRNIKNI